MGKRGRKRKWKCKFLLFWLTWRLSILDHLSSSDFVLPSPVFFLSNKLPVRKGKNDWHKTLLLQFLSLSSMQFDFISFHFWIRLSLWQKPLQNPLQLLFFSQIISSFRSRCSPLFLFLIQTLFVGFCPLLGWWGFPAFFLYSFLDSFTYFYPFLYRFYCSWLYFFNL